GENITEEHPLNGTTPYALSKIKAEKYWKGGVLCIM
ncbi:putative DNTP-hexose dehydratase-epimerase domain protein, partial [Bacteroides fragilis str. 20793-3]